ncbi:MAG: PIN domain-containing protein [Gammaproteobacteria bacterium]|nr:PIN domain-containing protein [Gammaproteobacteria bacterium]
MYLVDTSVWVDFVRGRDLAHVAFLRDLLSNPLAVSITHLVYLEILQGARNRRGYDRLKDYFGGQRFVAFDEPLASHAAAARMYLDCRRRGVTIRSGVDCLIAQCAIESNLTLLHHDRDFTRIATVEPAFQQKSFLHVA